MSTARWDVAVLEALVILTHAKVACVGEAHDRACRYIVQIASGLPPELCGEMKMREVLDAYSLVDGAWKRLYRGLRVTK